MPAKSSVPKSAAAATKSAPVKRASKKTTPVVEATSAPEPVVEAVVEAVVAPVSTEASTVSTLSTADQIEADFTSLQSRLNEFKAIYTSITSDLRSLQKTMQRHIKESGKRSRRPKMVDPNKPKRPPSGFAKPALISSELCSFLKVAPGSEMARTEVTKHLTNYIKEQNLQDQANKRRILPDTALQKLLHVESGDEVTYFNLQKYMKVHFPKSAATIAAEAASAVNATA